MSNQYKTIFLYSTAVAFRFVHVVRSVVFYVSR